MKFILVVGRPGSGKSTQCKALAEERVGDYYHVNLGEVVREHLKNAPDPSLQAMMQRGELLPEATILAILKNHLLAVAKQQEIQLSDKTILLDGYPRNETQYQHLLKEIGRPLGVVELDCSDHLAIKRIKTRKGVRSDANELAITKRLRDYHLHTTPLNQSLKNNEHYLSVNTEQILSSSTHAFKQALDKINTEIKQASLWQVSSSYLTGSGKITELRDTVNQALGSRNFLVPRYLMPPLCFLETPNEVKQVLRKDTQFGGVYGQFAKAAGLKYDFTALATHKVAPGEFNTWRFVRQAFSAANRSPGPIVQRLITKNISLLLAGQPFDLEQRFETFFSALWCQYLFGEILESATYSALKKDVLEFMKHCFYQNRLKSMDLTGLSAWLYAYPNKAQLKSIKSGIAELIKKSQGGFVGRFRQALEQQNAEQGGQFSEEQLNAIVEDNVFDLLFIPDFLQGALYQTVALGIKQGLDFSAQNMLEQTYQQGLKKSYLFPYRTRTLKEPVLLANGTLLPTGTTAVLSIKKAGLYHSVGPRMCAGIGFTREFKQHFFNVLKHIDFHLVSCVKKPKPQTQDENVPLPDERLSVSWQLKRNKIQSLIHHHPYKGQRFFDVLELNEKPAIRELMVVQLVDAIKQDALKRGVALSEIVIAAPALRGLPIASIIASRLSVPFFTIRKTGGYKMSVNDTFNQAYEKGYGETDSLELPKTKADSLKDQVAYLIDDGVASGESLLACQQVLQKAGVKPDIMAYSLVKHHYKPLNPQLKRLDTLVDFKAEPSAATLLPFLSKAKGQAANTLLAADETQRSCKNG